MSPESSLQATSVSAYFDQKIEDLVHILGKMSLFELFEKLNSPPTFIWDPTSPPLKNFHEYLYLVAWIYNAHEI